MFSRLDTTTKPSFSLKLGRWVKQSFLIFMAKDALKTKNFRVFGFSYPNEFFNYLYVGLIIESPVHYFYQRPVSNTATIKSWTLCLIGRLFSILFASEESEDEIWMIMF